MKEFDYIIIGGGCAGLSLAYELEIFDKLKISFISQLFPAKCTQLIILGNLFLLKGKVFDLQGDRRNAIEYYKKCIGLNNLSSAIKESKQYLKKSYTDYGS